MDKQKKKNIIKLCVFISCISVVLLMTAIILILYEKEGEKNMPFQLSKITIVSTAEGIKKEDPDNKWNLDVIQNNDIYFTIEKNPVEAKEERIDKILFENFRIITAPAKGKIVKYMPNSMEGRTFENQEDYQIHAKLEYKGAQKDDPKNLQIGNQGGMVSLRYSNTQLGNYISNEEEEIKHDGTLLSKIGMENKDISFQIAFDFIIKLEKKAYKTTIKLDLPSGDIIAEGKASTEKTDLQDFVFKRTSY